MVGEYNKKLTDVLGKVTDRQWNEYSNPPEPSPHKRERNINESDDIDYDNAASAYPDIEPVDDPDNYYTNPPAAQEDDFDELIQPIVEPSVQAPDPYHDIPSSQSNEETAGYEQEDGLDPSDNQALKDALGEDFEDITFDDIEDDDQDDADNDEPDPLDALDEENDSHTYEHDELLEGMADDESDFDADNLTNEIDSEHAPEDAAPEATPASKDSKKPGLGLPIYLLLVAVILSGLTYLGYITYNLLTEKPSQATSATDRAQSQQDGGAPSTDSSQDDNPQASAESDTSPENPSDDGFMIANIDNVAEPPAELVIRMQKDRERAAKESDGEPVVDDEPIDVVAALAPDSQPQLEAQSIDGNAGESIPEDDFADDQSAPEASVTIRPDEKIEQAFADLDQNDSSLAKEAFMDGINEAFGEVDNVSLRVSVVEEKISRIEEVLTRASEQFQLAEQQIAELSTKIDQYQSPETTDVKEPAKPKAESKPQQGAAPTGDSQYTIGDISNNNVEITYKGETQTYSIGSPVPAAGLLVSIDTQSRQVRTTTGLIGN